MAEGLWHPLRHLSRFQPRLHSLFDNADSAGQSNAQ